MDREQWLGYIRQAKAIAVIRAPTYELGRQMAHAAAAGGLTCLEITWTNSQAARLVTQLRAELPSCQIGAGTLLTREQLEEAVKAGAQFGFSPHTDLALIEAALARSLPFIPGALTPSEIVSAWQAGAASVKVFPITAVGGASYLRSLQGPLGHMPLIPTGGVSCEDAVNLLEAGAIAVGLGSDLFPRQDIQQANWKAITHRAAQLVASLTDITSQLPSLKASTNRP
ncbi:bifunctional 4-hydroxy-2-oxoglutarate aldolase/2-dehydro-3-deoxy-phosphogluconate aldolase [Sphaerothrix gracilis]|uniref:bifunctional 4-hydroxy-2-oxoglutarate aldolase/2-dehydro-3-deoxy-phosphogluconate aldolase n=1 Tax=Sphaerothrix gracilis TaxID=3151835 RepID=UPI0031FDA84C